MSDLQQRITQAKLRGDQKRIAAVIRAELHRTAFMTGHELAGHCSVSVSAITRFAQKLGYRGYPELKRALEELYRSTTTPYEVFESFSRATGSGDIAAISLARDVESIRRMEQLLDPKTFEGAVSELYRAQTIHLAAIGAAEALVDYFARYLEALGKKVVQLKSFGISRVAEVTEFSPDDFLVAFSFQRILVEVLDVVRHARRLGVTTAAVTDSLYNPLAEEADMVLVAPVSGTTFALSLAAPLALTNMLTNSLAARDQQQSRRALKKVKEWWETYPVFCDSHQNRAK